MKWYMLISIYFTSYICNRTVQRILKGIYGRAVKSIWNGSFANYSAAIFSTTLKQWNPLEDTDVIFFKGYSKALCALAATLVGIPVEACSNMVFTFAFSM